MKVDMFAKKHNLNYDELRQFLLAQNSFRVEKLLFDSVIKDEDETAILVAFRAYKYAKKQGKNEQELRDIVKQKAAEVKQDEAKRKEEQERRIVEEQMNKKRVMSQMLISSGFNFEGYRIVKYSGYISGDDAIEIPRGTAGALFFGKATDVGDALMSSLAKIRRNALQELKEAAYNLGCNAVIGVDFDYITLEPETANVNGGTTYLPYVFGVTANGNAVIIEKIEDDE